MTAVQTPGDLPTAAPLSGAARFRDPTNLTRWLTALIWILIAVDVAVILFTFFDWMLLDAFQQHTYTSVEAVRADAVVNGARMRITGLLHMLIFPLTAIVFLCWVHRANTNARKLGALDMLFTPGWSVAWYFIPFANLWMPYQAMKEIWMASSAPDRWKDVRRGAILPWWWFCFLLAGAAGNISFYVALQARDIALLMAADVVTIAAGATGILSDFLALALVQQIYRMQMSHVRT